MKMALFFSIIFICSILYPYLAFAQDSLNVTRLGQLGFSTFLGDPHIETILDEYAYLVVEGNPQNDGMHIVNIIDPYSPESIGFFQCTDLCHISVFDSIAYLSGGDWPQYLKIVNITNPYIPEIITDFPFYEGPIDIEDTLLYLACSITNDGDSLFVINVANPLSLQVVGRCELPDYPRGITVVGDYAYIADSYQGLQIINVSNVSSPFIERSFNTPGEAMDVAVYNNIAYIADGDSGLRILDVSDTTIMELGSFITMGEFSGQIINGYVAAVAVTSNHVFLADEWLGLRVINVTDPTNPQETGYYSGFGESKVVYDGDYAYFSAYYNFSIFDCSVALPVEKNLTNENSLSFSLMPPFPNPFNSVTTLRFSLQKAVYVSMSIYDIEGSEIACLINSFQPAGIYQRTFDASGLASGVYFVCLKAEGFSQTQKLLLIK